MKIEQVSTDDEALVLVELPANTTRTLQCQTGYRVSIHRAVLTETYNPSPDDGQCRPPKSACQLDFSSMLRVHCERQLHRSSCPVSSCPEDVDAPICRRDSAMRLTVLYHCANFMVAGLVPDAFCSFRRTSRYCR
ncbi:hypothetical protein BV898_19577 [Hypsibius exemplaris]|uniref:Uncharacterized protein n=1 Tax=Hypsibius exemplaris TaxID=2072580 RepID=A0A9X6RP27_HYPEX|nr:hypothetical protein BV898_19577 [Hypsibius exemplaris]